jgi:hypothetical protein
MVQDVGSGPPPLLLAHFAASCPERSFNQDALFDD